MVEECKLRAAVGQPGAPCDEDECVFWRVADHLDLGTSVPKGECAVQHFELLGHDGDDVTAWLLSVKERVEALEIR